jgi:hypothetical protein
MNAELEETRKLVGQMNKFLTNYLSATRGTADEPVAKRAAGRVEEALIECMRKATDELTAFGLQEAPLPDYFECSFCGAQHDLTKDRELLQSPRPADAAPAHIVLMRARRYDHRHAKEVVRQLEARGELTGASA